MVIAAVIPIALHVAKRRPIELRKPSLVERKPALQYMATFLGKRNEW